VSFIFLRGHIYLFHSLLPTISEIAASPKYSQVHSASDTTDCAVLNVRLILQHPTPTLETTIDYRCGRRGFGSGFGSASMDEIFQAVHEFFEVAAKTPFQVSLKTVPLRDVASVWSTPERASSNSDRIRTLEPDFPQRFFTV